MLLKTTLRRLVGRLRALLFPLLRKSIWAVGDQGLFAGTHFILNVLLARWLTPEAYGAFAVVYSAFLVLVLIHDALLIQPLLVFGSRQFRNKFSVYLRTLALWGNSGLAIAGGLLLAAAGTWFGYTENPHLAASLFACAAAQPFILFLWLMRRATYVHDKQNIAVGGGIAYVVIVVFATIMLRQWSALTASVTFLVLGGAALVVGVGIMWQLIGWVGVRPSSFLLTHAFGKHWRYGRWAAGTGVMIWVIGNVYILLLPIWGGLEASGALKALLNLVQPVMQAYMAFSALLIPEFVRAQAEGHFRQKAIMVTVCFLLGAGAYWFVLASWDAELLHLLYGGQYNEYTDLLWLLGALPFVDGVKVVLEAGLRAVEKPDLLFWAYLGSTLVTLTAGVVLLAFFGLAGAAIGLTASSVAVSVGATWFMISYRNHDKERA